MVGTAMNLTGATLNIVAYAPGAIGGNLHVFFGSLNNTTVVDSAATDVALSTLTSGFKTVSIPVPAASGNYTPANVVIIRIEIEAGAAFGTTFQAPATIVYFDSISASNAAFNDTFTTDPTGCSTIFCNSGARQLTGSANAWQAAYP